MFTASHDHKHTRNIWLLLTRKCVSGCNTVLWCVNAQEVCWIASNCIFVLLYLVAISGVGVSEALDVVKDEPGQRDDHEDDK